MGEKFYPDRFLKQVMPKSFYTQGLVSKNFTLQKGAISAINRARLATGRPIDKTVYDVLLQYKAKYKDLIAAEDFGKTQAFEAALNGENLLRQRIEQAVIFDKIQDLKAQHKGEFYRWMPSSAENPDPQHGLLYGKIFRVGEGDKEGNMPGERYGCQCGIEWLGPEDMTPNEKIQAVKIDFRKNNILPPLNQKYLDLMGAGHKQVVFLRRTLRRNKTVHSELRRKDYELLTGESLYKPIMDPFQDSKNKNYWHYIGTIDNKERFSFVIVDSDMEKANLEIVHTLKTNKRGFKKLMKRYKK